MPRAFRVVGEIDARPRNVERQLLLPAISRDSAGFQTTGPIKESDGFGSEILRRAFGLKLFTDGTDTNCQRFC